MKKSIIFLLIVILIFPLIVLARIGVGVGIGKIEVDESLKPGGVYDITPLVVLNTGDEPSDYEIKVNYHAKQAELQPSQEWFSFIPSPFHLEPGQSQNVAMKLTLPVKTNPGDYFAYLEAHPIIKAGAGTTIGVAAATKLYFTVVPANILQAIAFRIFSFLKMYSPWSWVVLALIAGAVIIVVLRTLFKKFLKLQIKISKK